MLTLFLSLIDDPQDQRLFDHLYHRYKNYMFKTAFNMLGDQQLAEDAVQEAFLRISVNFETFKANLESIRELKQLGVDADAKEREEIQLSCPKTRAYVVVIIRRVCLNTLDRLKRQPETTVFDTDMMPRSGLPAEGMNADAAEEEEHRLVYECIYEAICSLPDSTRDIMLYYIVFEHKPAEIANLFGISKDQVYKALRRGRETLRKDLRDKLNREFDIRW